MMGKWGPGIMEGDSPMDEMDGLAAVCGVEYSEPSDDADGDGYIFTPEALNKKQTRLAELAENNTYDGHITYQVWAYLVMKHGAEMTEKMQTMFLSSCDSDPGVQEGDEERRESINDFRKKVEAYRGHPVKLLDHARGLFHRYLGG